MFKTGKMKRIVLYIIAMLFFSFITNAQEIIALYKDSIPDSKKSEKKETLNAGIIRGVVKPTLEIYLPEKEKATGTAVVICPGGSYAVLVYQGEGITMAKELAKNGIACFILKYRLPDDSIMLDKSIGPLQDAQQAIKLVRENAAKWGVDANKIGIMGFSAGGHLATTEATHFEKAYIQNTNNTSLRPDFQVLVYPVISMQDNLTHADSRKNLLGKNPSKEIMNLFSNEMQVTKNSPPAYLTHAADDNVVDVDNSIAYFEKLRHNKVDVEMHVYPKGGHGFIFRHPGWMEPLLQWMKNNNWIK